MYIVMLKVKKCFGTLSVVEVAVKNVVKIVVNIVAMYIDMLKIEKPQMLLQLLFGRVWLDFCKRLWGFWLM